MFKRIIPLVVIIFTLGACSNDDEAEKKKEIIGNIKEPLQSDNFQDESSGNVTLEEGDSFLEIQTVIDQIDDEYYIFQTMTDNKNQRVLLAVNDEGMERYKTIFIKKIKRLKIIDLAGDGEIYNETITVED